MLVRRALRPRTYPNALLQARDSALRWPAVHRQVEARAQTRGSDMQLVQVGANDGSFMDPAQRYLQRGGWKALLVEPVPWLADKLEARYRDQPGVKVARVAITGYDGEATFHAPIETSTGQSRLQGSGSFSRDNVLHAGWTVKDAPAMVEEITVPTRTLPSLLKEYGVDSGVDWFVTDTEGHDAVILDQVMGLPEQQLPNMVLFEHAFMSRGERRGVVNQLGALGFTGVQHMRRDTFASQPQLIAA